MALRMPGDGQCDGVAIQINGDGGRHGASAPTDVALQIDLAGLGWTFEALQNPRPCASMKAISSGVDWRPKHGVSVGETAKLLNDFLMLDHELHPASTAERGVEADAFVLNVDISLHVRKEDTEIQLRIHASPCPSLWRQHVERQRVRGHPLRANGRPHGRCYGEFGQSE